VIPTSQRYPVTLEHREYPGIGDGIAIKVLRHAVSAERFRQVPFNDFSSDRKYYHRFPARRSNGSKRPFPDPLP
jgi:hypothetical protein